MKHKCLQYWLQGAGEAGVSMHPQLDMERLGLGNYYYAIPETCFSCWIFEFKEWPDIELPRYIQKKELDDETFPELKPPKLL